ncbi:hypothetical protein JCM8547_001052 [Rhodosporidiobolus lusitaniae]
MEVESSRTLPSSHALPRSSLHPHHALAVVCSPPNSSSPSLSLYRTAQPQADLVWTWLPPPLPQTNPPPPLKGLAAIKAAKNKAAGAAGGAQGSVEYVQWSPAGNFLAAVVSPSSSSSPSPSPSTLHLIALDLGTSLAPTPLPLPLSNKAKVTHLAWLSLPFFSPSASSSSDVPSWSLRLIAALPPLPKVTKEGLPSASSGPGSSLIGAGPGGGPGAGGGGGGGGVFGAKQAMLERERAKEAQRALSIRDACVGIEGGAGWPTMVVPLRTGGGEGDEQVEEAMRFARREREEVGGRGGGKTLLVVGDSEGKVHLYLGGSVFLGSFPASLSSSSPSSILHLSLLPSSSPTSLRLALYSSPTPSSLSLHPLSLTLPPSLSSIVALSTALHSHTLHAFSALQEARNAWDEARRIGKGWLVRLADVSRPHGITHPPHLQLLLLLTTGRPSASLHDFLASKMNERGLVKWEFAMSAALGRLRSVGWTSLAPACERVVVMIEEVLAWSSWPARFPHSPPSPLLLRRALLLATHLLRVLAAFQLTVEEEERRFVHFWRWVRYELDLLTFHDLPSPSHHHQHPSDLRPLASFHPSLVAEYIRHSLPPHADAVVRFVSLGLAAERLEGNEEVRGVNGWVEGRVPDREEEGGEEGQGQEGKKNGRREELERTLKRLKEEVEGQIRAQELEEAHRRTSATAPYPPSAARRAFGAELEADLEADLAARPHPPASFSTPTTDPDFDTPPHHTYHPPPSSSSQPPPALSSENDAFETAPKSLPALLHVLAGLLGEAMDGAVRGAVRREEKEEGEGGGEVVRDSGEGEEKEEEKARVRTGRVRSRGRGASIAECWVRGDVIRFTRPLPSPPSSSDDTQPDLSVVEHAAYALSASSASAGERVKVIEFEFLRTSSSPVQEGHYEGKEEEEDEEVVFGCEVTKEGASTKHLLAIVPLSSLSWHSSPLSSSSPLPPLLSTPAIRTLPLDAQYSPSALSFASLSAPEGGKKGVRVGLLGGEGRRLEVWSASKAGGEDGKGGGGGEGRGGDTEMA